MGCVNISLIECYKYIFLNSFFLSLLAEKFLLATFSDISSVSFFLQVQITGLQSVPVNQMSQRTRDAGQVQELEMRDRCKN